MMFPNLAGEYEDHDDGAGCDDASIWITAATIHRRNVAMMKEQQRSTFENGGRDQLRTRSNIDTLLSANAKSSHEVSPPESIEAPVSKSESSKSESSYSSEQPIPAPPPVPVQEVRPRSEYR